MRCCAAILLLLALVAAARAGHYGHHHHHHGSYGHHHHHGCGVCVAGPCELDHAGPAGQRLTMPASLPCQHVPAGTAATTAATARAAVAASTPPLRHTTATPPLRRTTTMVRCRQPYCGCWHVQRCGCWHIVGAGMQKPWQATASLHTLPFCPVPMQSTPATPAPAAAQRPLRWSWPMRVRRLLPVVAAARLPRPPMAAC